MTPAVKTPLELYKLLPQANCRACFQPSCLAFSAAVIKGTQKASACPFLDNEIVGQFSKEAETREPYEIKREEELRILQERICSTDLTKIAAGLGGKMAGEKLAIQCLGKDFQIDQKGTVTSECHTHTGLTIPLLTYILHQNDNSRKKEYGEWIAFRKLRNGREMDALFQQRCENTMKRLADSQPDLFEALVSIFSGKRSEKHFSSDISLVLFPLPKIPVLVCYWEPEDDMDSMLRIFFDSTADEYLAAESIYALVVGLVMMFEKIVVKHI